MMFHVSTRRLALLLIFDKKKHMIGKLLVVFDPVFRPTRTNIDNNYETTERKEGLSVAYLIPKLSLFSVPMTAFLFFFSYL